MFGYACESCSCHVIIKQSDAITSENENRQVSGTEKRTGYMLFAVSVIRSSKFTSLA